MTITVTVLLRVAGEGERDFTLKEATFTLKATRASYPCMHGLAEMKLYKRSWSSSTLPLTLLACLLFTSFWGGLPSLSLTLPWASRGMDFRNQPLRLGVPRRSHLLKSAFRT